MVADECRAIEMFHRLGRAEVNRRLAEVGDIADQRMREHFASHPQSSLVGASIFFMTQEEQELRHLLQLSLMLCVDERQEARERIARRIAARRGVVQH